MLRLEKFFNSDTGRLLLSIMLGLGVAGLFKMSCDNRSCIVYKAPEFKQEKKIIKYNDKCYAVHEKMINCAESKGETIMI